MFITGTSLQTILSSAIEARAYRTGVINHNIANADTPDFKKSAVMFEDSLRQAVQNYRNTGTLDLSMARPVSHRIHTHLAIRLDGNNVDINEENVLLVRNSTIFDALMDSFMANQNLTRIVREGIQ